MINLKYTYQWSERFVHYYSAIHKNRKKLITFYQLFAAQKQLLSDFSFTKKCTLVKDTLGRADLEVLVAIFVLSFFFLRFFHTICFQSRLKQISYFYLLTSFDSILHLYSYIISIFFWYNCHSCFFLIHSFATFSFYRSLSVSPNFEVFWMHLQ